MLTFETMPVSVCCEVLCFVHNVDEGMSLNRNILVNRSKLFRSAVFNLGYAYARGYVKTS
jgi:hypothetical protein